MAKNSAAAAAAAAVATAAAPVVNAPKKPTAASKPRGHAGGKVFVFSKLEMALELQLCVEKMQPVRYKQEVWQEPTFVREGPVVTIVGTNYPIGAPPPDVIWPERPTMKFGYAVTPGVDQDFWESWIEQHKNDPMVKNSLIFAEEKIEDGWARARENKSRFTGLGPLQRGRDAQGNETITDPRQPRKVGGGQRLGRPAADEDASDLLAAE